jgi:hypothetical protein
MTKWIGKASLTMRPASSQANTGSAHRPGACASRTCTYVARTVTYVKEHRSASVLLAGLAAVLDFSGRRRTVMDNRRRRPGKDLRRELRLESNDARPQWIGKRASSQLRGVAMGVEPTVESPPHTLSRSRWDSPRASATPGHAGTTYQPNHAERPATPADETIFKTK